VKICYICPKFYMGEVPFFEYTQGLARLGHEVQALVTRRDGELRSEQVGGVMVERIAPDYSASNQNFRFSFLQFLSAAHEALDQHNDWDLINVRNLPGAALLPLFSKNRKSVWVLEIQSPPLHGGWRSTMSKFRIRLDAKPFATTLVHEQRVAEDIFGADNGRFVELPIGVDFDHFRPGKNPELRQSLSINQDEIVFIYTGTIKPIRRLHRVIEALQLALETLPDLYLMIIGEGIDVPRLKEITQVLGIASRVHFLGLVSYEDMPAVMHAADIGLGYVPRDSWFDKAPVLKTMESLASGLPTIATATSGNQKYIVDGINGLLVDDTPDDLAAAMIRLAGDKELRKQFSNGREHIRAYQWERIVVDILNPTYERLTA
jgi:glycosyltransferase involved in cell wall biosynthesis